MILLTIDYTLFARSIRMTRVSNSRPAWQRAKNTSSDKLNSRVITMKNAWNQAWRSFVTLSFVTLSFVNLSIVTLSIVALISINSIRPVQAAETDRETVFQQARQHLQQGQADMAYELLSQYEIDWSGEDAYDYLLGIAALDSGQPGEAIFSLQRLLATKPDFAGARMDLARAYYDIGDNELARVEFERVLSDNPPQQVATAANEYMKAINNRAREYSAMASYYFDFGFGHDSNAPAATDESIFLNFRLSDNNLEQSSAFVQAAFGALYNRPLSAESQLLFNARLDHRSNPSASFVDASNIDLGIGWAWKRGDNQISITTNSLFSALDNEYHKRDLGITASYMRKLSNNWSLSGFLRAASVRFEDALLEVRDVDRIVYGFTASQNFSNSMLNISINGSNDDAKDSTSPFSTDGYGLMISNSWFRPGGKIYFLEASANTIEFDDPFFDMNRDDDVYTISAGASWNKFPVDDWITTFRVNYSEKDSTVSLYEFDRVEVGFSFHKEL